MGVDLEVRFKTKRKLTREDLDDIGYNLLHRFNKILWPVRNLDGEPSYHPWPVEECKADDDEIPLSKLMYVVHTWCRWYGEGYERGPALQIYGLLRYLTTHPLVKSVWFFGDSGGLEDAIKATPDSMEELLAHWIAHGNLPYQRYFDKDNDGPICCTKRMIRNGWGGGGKYKAWFCAACGMKIEERDGVRVSKMED